MIDTDQINFALAVFTFGAGAVIFYIWRKAVELREALKGQDGYRLMVIFCGLFALGVFASLIIGLQYVLLLTMPDADWARQLLSGLRGVITLVVYIWALMRIRDIVHSGGMHE